MLRPFPGSVGRVSAMIAILVAIVVLAAQAAFAATPVPVLADPDLDEFQPSASSSYLVWSGNTAEHPRHSNVYARAWGGNPIRVNERGTIGYQGSVDGTTVLYSRGEPHEPADLWLYDLQTGTRSDPGRRVNSRYFEFQPNISGRYYFFERGKFRGPTQFEKVILYDSRSGSFAVLAQVDPRTGFLDADQINGDWLVWESCVFSHNRYSECDVFRHRISTGRTVRLPNPGAQQYSPGVASDGTVYYVRNGGSAYWRCGAHAKIVRYPLRGPATVLTSIAHGTDVFAQSVLEGQYGLVTDYFDETRCSDFRSDVYKLEDDLSG
jgi:hypothetical protein